MSDEFDDDFLDNLAGKKQNHPFAKAVRDELLDEEALLKELDSYEPEPLSKEKQAKYDAIKKRLKDKGVFDAPEAQNKSGWRLSIPSWLSNIFTFNKFDFVATVATIAIVSFLVFKSDDFGTVSHEQLNNQIQVVSSVRSTDPASEINKLSHALTEAKATVESTQVDDTEWTMVVTASDVGVIEDIKAILQANGIAITSEPPYLISIKKE